MNDQTQSLGDGQRSKNQTIGSIVLFKPYKLFFNLYKVILLNTIMLYGSKDYSTKST